MIDNQRGSATLIKREAFFSGFAVQVMYGPSKRHDLSQITGCLFMLVK